MLGKLFARVGLAFDLGTEHSSLYVPGRGLIRTDYEPPEGYEGPIGDEQFVVPSIVAYRQMDGSFEALRVGREAYRMIGRVGKVQPIREEDSIGLIRPLDKGRVISEDALAAVMCQLIDFALPTSRLRPWIRRALKKNPDVVVPVPHNTTGVEKRAIENVVRERFYANPHIVSEPTAALIGAGLDFGQAKAAGIIDIGGGTTDLAIMSCSEIAHRSVSLEVGGRAMNQAIIRHMKAMFSVTIGEPTAEFLKRNLASANGSFRTAKTVKAKPPKGDPVTLTVGYENIHEPLEPVYALMAAGIREYLETVPAELYGDLYAHGIWLTGGGSLIHGLPEYLHKATGFPIKRADRPLVTVALGAGKMLENPILLEIGKKSLEKDKETEHAAA